MLSEHTLSVFLCACFFVCFFRLTCVILHYKYRITFLDQLQGDRTVKVENIYIVG